MKKVITIIMTLALAISSQAFVMLGPVATQEQTLTFGGTPVVSANISDDLGGPKQLDEFYRWNTPDLTYGFDQSFVQFFGQEGINAVDDAMRAINDYFIPEDGSYAGVSSLNLAKHGFGGNYNTAWLNATAANENLIDIKSLTLGMMVNYLGLGNPYRYAFTATNSLVPNTNTPGAIFSVVLKNFDPITLAKNDVINGVQYSYRLIHDQPAGSQANVGTVGAMTLDMEEFTSDSSGNAYSAVSAIVDAFYGNTDLIWTDVPSLFNFGVYYDGMNAMGGMYQPRHALTHDDAGGLKYLYSTNTIAMEYNPYTLISPADFTAPVAQYGLPPSNSEIVNRAAGIFPTRNGAGLPNTFASTHPLNQFNNPAGLAGVMSGGSSFWGANVGKMDWAYRGGIDTIQLHPVSFDSLLLMNHYSTNFIWTDTFMTNAQIQAQVPATALNTTPGASIALTDGRSHYFQQVLGRSVPAPDFLFTAAGLGTGPAGVPVAFTRDTWTDSAAPAAGTPATGAARMNATSVNILQEIPVGASGPGTLASGTSAGTSSFQIQFNNAYAVGGFEVVWNGEISVVGDMAVPTTSQQWAYIKGPGPADISRFPDGSFSTLVQNTILPVEGVPVITLVSDSGGVLPISPNSLTRTTEELTILGRNFRDATALEIIDQNEAIVQLIYPITDYILDDGRILIPNGVIGFDSEGINRRIRVWNTLGSSDPSEEIFSIITGPPVVTSTTFDGLPWDRAEPLTITGVGFRSRQVNINAAAALGISYSDGNNTITNVSIETAAGVPLDGNGSGLGRELISRGPDNTGHTVAIAANTTIDLDVLSDTRMILRGDWLTTTISGNSGWADGLGRVLRVSRGNTPGYGDSQTQSATPASMFSVISTKPLVTNLTWVDLADSNQTDINSTSALRRDEAIWIRGVGLNTTSSVELVRENGTSYNPPITAYFTAADMDDNGSLLRLGKYAFNSNLADGFGPVVSKLKLTNLFGDTLYVAADGALSSFNVNIQPNDGTLAENESVLVDGMRVGAPFGINANLWDRTVTTGDDLTFIGAGLKAIKRIEMVGIDGVTAMTPNSVFLELDPLGTPGVIVTDTLIQIDTSVAQFNEVNGTDATNSTDYRRFRLSSETQLATAGLGAAPNEDLTRNAVLTTAINGQRFLVGRPPSITDMYIANPLGVDVGDMNWNRDSNATTSDSNATIRGRGLRMVNRIEMLDGEGSVVASSADVILPVPGFNIVTATTGWTHSGNPNVQFTGSLLNINDWTDQLELNSTIWSTNGPLLDSSVAGSRRIRITTPWGYDVSDSNGSGEFTFTANPDLQGTDMNSSITGTPVLTYGGGGFNGIDSYDFNTTNPTTPNYLNVNSQLTWQDLVINGANFLSISRIGFTDEPAVVNTATDNDSFEVDVDPRNPPAGITFTADGTQIRITGSYLWQNANAWLGAHAGGAQRLLYLHTINTEEAIASGSRIDDNQSAMQTPLFTIDPTWNDNNP